MGNDIISYIGKTLITILLSSLLLNSTVSAQETLSPLTQQDFLTSGFYGGGLTFIDGDAYIRIQLQPEFPIGKVGIGFDLVLLYNPYAENSNEYFLAEDGEVWDSPSTWLRLIRYISYAKPYDPLYFRFGEFDYLTIGHGSIMSGYSNFDRRGLHFNLRRSDSKSGLESMVNDIGNPTIFGGRLFTRPFQRTEKNNMFTRFEIGTTYITDIDPDSLQEDEEPLHTFGIDVGFPIIEKSSFRLDLYNDVAMLNPPPKPDAEETRQEEMQESENLQTLSSEPIDKSFANELAWGNATGIGFATTKALFKFEYRIFSDGYIPAVFDYTYESGMPVFWGHEESNEARRGFYTQILWLPMQNLHLLGTFEAYTNNTSKLYLGVIESGLVPRMTFKAFYTKRNIGEDPENNFFEDLFDLDEKSMLNLQVAYMIIPPIQTIFTNEYRFRRETNDNGTYQFKPIHKTSIMFGVSSEF